MTAHGLGAFVGRAAFARDHAPRVRSWILGRESALEGPGAPAAVSATTDFSAQCAGCHTLAAADPSGTVGANLDETELGEEEIAAIVRDGRGAGLRGTADGRADRGSRRFVAGSR